MFNIEKEINNKSILITGGTGSFGNMLTKILLTKYQPKKIVIFSRDEYKQDVMKKLYPEDTYKNIRYFIGDVRNYERLELALHKIDIVFHAAALKQVPALEYNPTEAIYTNIHGSENVIKAAVKNNVSKVIALSTDKSVMPVNLYGATKMCLERLFVSANYMYGGTNTIFAVVRYGNVLGSRGSVVPLFLEQKNKNVLTLTDPRMTRFTLTLEDAVMFVLNNLTLMIGGEIYIPKLPSYNLVQIAKIIAPEAEHKIIGIRPGEKLHESMICPDESYLALEFDKFYVLTPFIKAKMNKNYDEHYKCLNPKQVEKEISYNSGSNKLIDDNKLKELIETI